MADAYPRVLDWYRRVKARPSFEAGIGRWENAGYLELMRGRGAESWPKVEAILGEIRRQAA
jgi:hypothetical protein